jgi:hypothetical protein
MVDSEYEFYSFDNICKDAGPGWGGLLFSDGPPPEGIMK